MIDSDITLLTHLLKTKTNQLPLEVLKNETGLSSKEIKDRVKLMSPGQCEVEIDSEHIVKIKHLRQTLEPLILNAFLRLDAVPIHLKFLSETDSTNTDADNAISNGEETPLVVIAQKQKAGRGRMGRKWFSQDRGNLTMSFGFTPHLSPQKMQRFTLWMGMAISETLNDKWGLPVKVKWPNDIVYKGKKMAGMLSETRVEGDFTRAVIFGIGMNVNSTLHHWPESLQRTATSLSHIAGHTLNLNAIASSLIQSGLNAYDAFVSGRYETHFQNAWNASDALLDQVITVNHHETHITGKARGIDEQGALQLELENKKVVAFQAGDVTLHKTYNHENPIH